jgi:hypothetical protein
MATLKESLKKLAEEVKKYPTCTQVEVTKNGVKLLDENGNLLAVIAFSASFSLITMGVGIYALSVVLNLANLSADDPLYAAMQQLPTIMIGAIGAVGLGIVLMCIGAGMLVFGQSMPGGRA